MCSGTAISPSFTTWLDFHTAVNSGDAGFGDVPALPGVYCLRARSTPITDPDKIIAAYKASPMYTALHQLDDAAEQFFVGAGIGAGWAWEYAPFAGRRLERVRAIPRDDAGRPTCPIIYLGCSKSLHRRMHELLWLGHTVNHPLWALLHVGWKFDLGLKTCSDYKAEEKRLKAAHRASHAGVLPPLMDR